MTRWPCTWGVSSFLCSQLLERIRSRLFCWWLNYWIPIVYDGDTTFLELSCASCYDIWCNCSIWATWMYCIRSHPEALISQSWDKIIGFMCADFLAHGAQQLYSHESSSLGVEWLHNDCGRLKSPFSRVLVWNINGLTKYWYFITSDQTHSCWLQCESLLSPYSIIGIWYYGIQHRENNQAVLNIYQAIWVSSCCDNI